MYNKIFVDHQLIAILQIESPFLKAFYIDKSINIAKVFDVDSVVSVALDKGIFYRHNGHSFVPIKAGSNLRLEKDKIYRKTGGLNIVDKEYFEKNKVLTGKRVGHVLVDELSGMTIGSELSWNIAKMLLNSGYRNEIIIE